MGLVPFISKIFNPSLGMNNPGFSDKADLHATPRLITALILATTSRL